MRSLLGLAGLLVLAASLGAAAAGTYAAWAWRHHRECVLICVMGIVGTLAVAVMRAAMLQGAMPPPEGWPGWLRLLADAALAAIFLLLLRRMAQQAQQARRRAEGGPLNAATGLPNRSGFLDRAGPALARCRREGQPAAILAVALADPNRIEAQRGPFAAREALRDLAAVLRDTARAADLAGHVAAEAPAAFLPATTAEGAVRLAERLRAAARDSLPSPAMDGTRLRLAIGIAPVGDGAGPAVLDEAMDAALAALARALAAGGGTEIAPPPPRRSAA